MRHAPAYPDDRGTPGVPAPAAPPGPVPPLTSGDVMSALRDVVDPEWPVSIVDMGLVHAVAVDGGVVSVTLTLTSTGCPCVEMIREDIRDRLRRLPGVGDVRIALTWDPPWTSDRLSEVARERFRRWGVAV